MNQDKVKIINHLGVIPTKVVWPSEPEPIQDVIKQYEWRLKESVDEAMENNDEKVSLNAVLKTIDNAPQYCPDLNKLKEKIKHLNDITLPFTKDELLHKIYTAIEED